MLKISKKLLLIPILATVITFGLAVSANANYGSGHGDFNRHFSDDTIVGVWEVDADAPYKQHLFTFHADGTMTTTNPTNVQENASDAHGGTNDSLGMGVWKTQKKNGVRYVVGTFEQLNAFADDHQPTDTLSVSFKITVDGDTFDGPAKVKLGALTDGSHITGKRLKIDQAAIDSL